MLRQLWHTEISGHPALKPLSDWRSQLRRDLKHRAERGGAVPFGRAVNIASSI
jgi:hypothetical protein